MLLLVAFAVIFRPSVAGPLQYRFPVARICNGGSAKLSVALALSARL